MIIMEYCQKGSLWQLIKEKIKNKEFPFREEIIGDYLENLLKGLGHIHGLGIIHRDIKPHNIFLGDDSIIKIGDFGISKILSNSK